jgi:uncharacterized protein
MLRVGLSMKNLLKNLLKILTIGFIAIFLLITYVRKVEPVWIEVVQVPLTLPNLSPALEGYRIVQITDVHSDGWMTTDRIKKISQRINAQHPDLITLTGDFVTNDAETFAPALKSFADLKAPDGSIAILGNHDEATNAKFITEVLESSNVKVLKNQVLTIEHKGGLLNIAGLGDAWSGEDDMRKVLQQLPGIGASIMLAHEPDVADQTAATGKFDLQLSGHSHGGQVSLPFMKLVTPPMGHKYPIGQYQVGDLIQYTSRGVGTSGVRVRFNCRPEITVITLHAPITEASHIL